MLECVVNISEGRNIALLAGLAGALSGHLLDVHTDADHNRSVFTLVGEEAPRLLTRLVVDRLSLDDHEGVHPRLGVVDVVPFVPLFGSTFADAERARDEYARWVAAVCAGAREPLIAYNVWLHEASIEVTRDIAREVRTGNIRTLGLQVGSFTQVSMNLVSPGDSGPMQAYDSVVACAERRGVRVAHAELVGLLPADVLAAVPGGRWEELDLSEDRTIEARLAAAGISR